MLVDHEAVLLGLKRHIASKPHHGQRELAVVIAQLEVANQIEEGLPERALRLYGLTFFEEAIDGSRTPSSFERSVAQADGDQDRAPRGDSSIESEEDIHARNGREAGGPRRYASSRSRAARALRAAP